jgi:sensor domain CHASE-containing protein
VCRLQLEANLMQKSTARVPKNNIAFGVYALCVVVVITFAGVSWQLLSFAGGVADEVRDEVEQQLVQAEIARQLDILARDQSQISGWSKAATALRARFKSC